MPRHMFLLTEITGTIRPIKCSAHNGHDGKPTGNCEVHLTLQHSRLGKGERFDAK